jgi:hypothetical protein
MPSLNSFQGLTCQQGNLARTASQIASQKTQAEKMSFQSLISNATLFEPRLNSARQMKNFAIPSRRRRIPW